MALEYLQDYYCSRRDRGVGEHESDTATAMSMADRLRMVQLPWLGCSRRAEDSTTTTRTTFPCLYFHSGQELMRTILFDRAARTTSTPTITNVSSSDTSEGTRNSTTAALLPHTLHSRVLWEYSRQCTALKKHKVLLLLLSLDRKQRFEETNSILLLPLNDDRILNLSPFQPATALAAARTENNLINNNDDSNNNCINDDDCQYCGDWNAALAIWNAARVQQEHQLQNHATIQTKGRVHAPSA